MFHGVVLNNPTIIKFSSPVPTTSHTTEGDKKTALNISDIN